MQHFQRWPLSTNVTNGLMYVRQRRQRAITESETTGTGSSPSSGRTDRMGDSTTPKGSLDFDRSELVVGIAFRVHRWYDGSTLARGEGVTVAFGGSTMGGGPASKSDMIGGCAPTTAFKSWFPTRAAPIGCIPICCICCVTSETPGTGGAAPWRPGVINDEVTSANGFGTCAGSPIIGWFIGLTGVACAAGACMVVDTLRVGV